MLKFYMIFAWKIIKMDEYLWYLPDKLTKFPNFVIIAQNAGILHDNCQKISRENLSRIFGGHGPLLAPSASRLVCLL